MNPFLRRSSAVLSAILLTAFTAAGARAVSSDYEEGYAQGILDSCAGILLIEPEEYTFVLNLTKHKIHEAGKKCGPDKPYNTAWFCGTAEELRAVLDLLGWSEAYTDCGNCKPHVMETGE